MNLKKFAIRGLVVLAICVALCMFFSGTIMTITTPKVKLASGKRGRMEEKTQLSAKIAFPNTEKFSLTLPADTALTITRVNTRVGYSVKAGDVLVEAEVANYEQALKQYQDAYDQALEQLLTLESKNRDIRINRRDEQYAEAYFALRDAGKATVAARMEMDVLLSQEGLTLPETGYPEGASDDLKKAVDAWRAASDAEQAAQYAMDEASRYSVEDAVWTYISERRDCQDKMAEAEENMRALMTLNASAGNITAPHDGYVAELNVKDGDAYDGSQPLYTLTPEGELPVLRADVSQVARAVAEGTPVTMSAGSYGEIETSVASTGIDAEGRKYVDVILTNDMVSAVGSIYSMTLEEVPLTLLYRARESTTLLPSGAVRGSGDERYVFVVENTSSTFGNTAMKLRKMEVTVLAESDGVTSVQEDLSYYTLAYMEDRPIDDGNTVMEYLD